MYDGIYLVFIRSLCIFVDILRSFIFFSIKYEYNITLNTQPCVLKKSPFSTYPKKEVLGTTSGQSFVSLIGRTDMVIGHMDHTAS